MDYKDLIRALKKAGFPTEDRVKKIVGDEVHGQLTEFYHGRIKPEFDRVDKELKSINKSLGKIPSRNQFNDLQARVDRYHPLN